MMTPEEYKLEQQKRASAFKVGSKDQSGYTIKKIYARGDEYVIYEIETSDIVDSLKVWIDTIIENNNVPIDYFVGIRENFTKAKNLLYKCVDKSATKAILADIVATAIESGPASANTQIAGLIQEINSEYEEQFKNRMRLLMSSLFIAAIFFCISLYTYLNKILVDYDHLRNLIFVAAGGSVGGFFSISIGINKIVSEKDVTKWLYFLYGAERIIISILAAGISYFAIQADLIFGLTKNLSNPIIVFIFFSILAGFSETLVPNILTKIEKET